MKIANFSIIKCDHVADSFYIVRNKPELSLSDNDKLSINQKEVFELMELLKTKYIELTHKESKEWREAHPNNI